MMKTKALTVFDIQRFALHDGPGIRTTVFLKGCPLDCLWCHNPESKKSKPQLGFLEKNCSCCGKCVNTCEHDVHIISANDRHHLQYQNCIQCGICINTCPNHALKIFGQQMTSEEIIKIVEKDRDFYERSGGGITVSGGEPMMQFEALRQLLQQAKEIGLHVCLDTSGQADTKKYEEIAKYVDIFLFDYKLTDPEEHKRYTGVANTLILHNLERLCQKGSQIYLRCPIIPGINDNESHYRAIGKLSRQYNNIQQINLMTYHDMAKGKAQQIGECYALSEIKTITSEGKKAIYEKVKSYGCLRLQQG